MKTGYSKICINPPYGAPIVGYYEPRFVKGIADDLFIRAVAFDWFKSLLLIIKDPQPKGWGSLLAEMEGFEPPHALRRLADFESAPFSHLGTSP